MKAWEAISTSHDDRSSYPHRMGIFVGERDEVLRLLKVINPAFDLSAHGYTTFSINQINIVEVTEEMIAELELANETLSKTSEAAEVAKEHRKRLLGE